MSLSLCFHAMKEFDNKQEYAHFLLFNNIFFVAVCILCQVGVIGSKYRPNILNITIFKKSFNILLFVPL